MTNFPYSLENALAEPMHRTLKVDATAEEFKLERGFPTFDLAQQAVARTIYIYNHIKCIEVENQVKRIGLPMQWKKYARKVNQTVIDAMVA